MLNYAFILLLSNPCVQDNGSELKDLSSYFTTKPFTSCSFNGIAVDCDRIPELIKKRRELDKSEDPNLMKP